MAKVLENAKDPIPGFCLAAHAPAGFDRDSQRFLRQQVLVVGKSLFGNQMMHRVRGEIIDRVDATAGDHLPIVGEDLHVHVWLEIGQVFITDRQRIAGDIADRQPLRRARTAPDIHPRVVRRRAHRAVIWNVSTPASRSSR